MVRGATSACRSYSRVRQHVDMDMGLGRHALFAGAESQRSLVGWSADDRARFFRNYEPFPCALSRPRDRYGTLDADDGVGRSMVRGPGRELAAVLRRIYLNAITKG